MLLALLPPKLIVLFAPQLFVLLMLSIDDVLRSGVATDRMLPAVARRRSGMVDGGGIVPNVNGPEIEGRTDLSCTDSLFDHRRPREPRFFFLSRVGELAAE
jgi:hypothetical protein